MCAAILHEWRKRIAVLHTRHVLEEEPAVQVAKALGLSLNSMLLAKSQVLKRLRQELAGLCGRSVAR